jgi:benzodiazapine receptor
MKAYVRLIVSVVLCQAAGIVGSLFTTPAINSWYAGLRRPAFAPPNWVFAPVWISLFLLMGISFFMVWNVGLEKGAVRKSIVIFCIQLLLNALWSYLFFGLRSPLMGFIEIVAMWLMILLTMLSFFKISRKAGLLLVPYLAWVSIASYLNYSILVLNP